MNRGQFESGTRHHDFQPSNELTAIVERWIRAVQNKDGKTLTALFSGSEHLKYIGSAPDEYFEGRILREGYAQHVNEIPEARFIGQKIEAFAKDNFGWAFWLGNIHFVERNETFEYRFSFVFSLEYGIWKILQVHVSTPRSNFEVAGAEHHAFRDLIEAAKSGGELSGAEGTTTIMFTDVANSTSLAAFLGDHAWSDVIATHFAELRSIIEEQNGTVVKTLGDGTMSSFDSARAALSASLAIQSAASSASREHALQVRIGLHTGDVVQKEGDFFGNVVNKAARIAAIAEPGSIFVSDTTRNISEGNSDLQFKKLRPVELRGIKGKHTIYLLFNSPQD
jgi:adenylate cyclase